MRHECSTFALMTTALAVLLIAGSAAQATVIEAPNSATVLNAYNGDISATDLVNAGRNSLASVGSAPDGPQVGFAITAANNGAGLADSTDSLWYQPGWTTNLTFTLNTNPATGGSATGYDISSVSVFAGWTDLAVFSDQIWDLQVATTTVPAFTSLHAVNFMPYTNTEDTAVTSSRVVLTDDTGVIATGVTAVRFAISKPTIYGTVFKEFDVYGTATIPEPATWIMLVAGLSGLLAYAWRKRR